MFHVKADVWFNGELVKHIWSNSRNSELGCVPYLPCHPFPLPHKTLHFPRRLVLISITWFSSYISSFFLSERQIKREWVIVTLTRENCGGLADASSIKIQSRAGSIHRWDGADGRFPLSWMEAACRGVSEPEVPSFIAANPPHGVWW